jgi:hypothetical protein
LELAKIDIKLDFPYFETDERIYQSEDKPLEQNIKIVEEKV